MTLPTAFFLLAAFVVLITLVPDFLAHVSRYLQHRRARPGHSRGYAWHVTSKRR